MKRKTTNVTPNAWKVCCKCGSTDHLHRHHVYQVNHGGVDEPWNLVWLCRPCHLTWHELRRARLLRGQGHRRAHWVFNKWLSEPKRAKGRGTVTAV